MIIKLCAECINMCVPPNTMLECKKGRCEGCNEEGIIFLVPEVIAAR